MNPRPDYIKTALAAFIVAAVCLWMLFTVGCGKRDIPSDTPKPIIRAWVPAVGRSMEPNFPNGALVEAEFGVRYEDLKVGDTVLLWDYTRTEPSFIHHRIVAEQGGQFIARGDNFATNPAADRPWVTRDNFIARTTGRHTQMLFAPKPP